MIDLHDYLSIGQSAVENRVVQHADTAESYSSGMKNLLASPKLMHMAIEASIHAIDIHLPQEYISVGVFTEFTHTAPTGLGMHVAVRATIREIVELTGWKANTVHSALSTLRTSGRSIAVEGHASSCRAASAGEAG